jgi:hypothetical protein
LKEAVTKQALEVWGGAGYSYVKAGERILGSLESFQSWSWFFKAARALFFESGRGALRYDETAFSGRPSFSQSSFCRDQPSVVPFCGWRSRRAKGQNN